MSQTVTTESNEGSLDLERPRLTLVPKSPDNNEVQELSPYNEALAETAKIVEAITARETRQKIIQDNGILLGRIGHLRAQVELITSNLRAHGYEPPEDEGYVGHNEVMQRVGSLNLDGRLADILPTDAIAIHDAFDTTVNRPLMMTYNTDNTYFRSWVNQAHPEDTGYLEQLHEGTHPPLDEWGHAIEPRPYVPPTQRFIQLYAEWWNTPGSIKNSRIVSSTSRKLGLENIAVLSPEQLLTLRGKVAYEVRELLYGDALQGWADSELPDIDRHIDFLEFELKRRGVEHPSEDILNRVVTRLQNVAPTGTEPEAIQRFVVEKGITQVDPEEEKSVAKSYLASLERYLEELEQKQDQIDIGHTALELVS